MWIHATIRAWYWRCWSQPHAIWQPLASFLTSACKQHRNEWDDVASADIPHPSITINDAFHLKLSSRHLKERRWVEGKLVVSGPVQTCHVKGLFWPCFLEGRHHTLTTRSLCQPTKHTSRQCTLWSWVVQVNGKLFSLGFLIQNLMTKHHWRSVNTCHTTIMSN